MRKRLLAVGLAIIGLGVPVLAAWFTRREATRRVEQAPMHVKPPEEVAAATPGLATSTYGQPPEPAGGHAQTDESPEPGPDGDEHVLEPHPTGVFAAVGRFDYRFRRWLPIIGLALVLGLSVWASNAGGKLIQGGWVIPGSEEQQAAQLLADRFGQQATTILVIYRAPNGDATDATFQSDIANALAPIATDSAVDGVTTWGQTHSELLLSNDKSMTMAVISLNKEIEASVNDAARLADEVPAVDGAEPIITGIPVLYHEFNQRIEHDLVQAEMVSLPIALLILLAVFGTLIAAGLPLLIAALTMPSAFAVIELLAGVTDMSIFVNNLATMIGLALAIDYSLFMVSRFREELRHHSVEIALERMLGSVGKAVAISGVAVAIGLSSLTVFGAAALRSMGIAGIVTVLSTLLFGLTVLPALLALLGHRVNRLRLPLPRFLRLVESDVDAADRRQGRGVWAWVAARVMRRPILTAIPVLVFLLALGSPFLSIQLSTGQNLADLPPTPARLGFETLIDEFPGGENDPITIAATWKDENLNDGIPSDQLQALQDYVSRIEALPNVTTVESLLVTPPGMTADQYHQLLAYPPAMWPDEVRAGLVQYVDQYVAGDTTRLRVFTGLLPDSEAGRGLVEQVRGVAPPDGAQVLTAGLPSRSADFMASFRSSVPIAILIVVLVTGGVLFLTFGSVFLPLKAVLMSLISISASFGALVWIFQQGHLSDQLGFVPSGALGAWLPLIMFAILFGLSMDYEVLLLSRIRERYIATSDNTRAVAEGIGLTGGIITGAALIMVAVFAAFALSSITFIKALGLTMALAVLIDATIVRGLLVPAFMRVMGWVNWWAPRWVQRAVARLGLYEDAGGVRARSTASRPDATPAT